MRGACRCCPEWQREYRIRCTCARDRACSMPDTRGVGAWCAPRGGTARRTLAIRKLTSGSTLLETASVRAHAHRSLQCRERKQPCDLSALRACGGSVHCGTGLNAGAVSTVGPSLRGLSAPTRDPAQPCSMACSACCVVPLQQRAVCAAIEFTPASPVFAPHRHYHRCQTSIGVAAVSAALAEQLYLLDRASAQAM